MSLKGNRKLIKAMVETGMDRKTARQKVKQGLAGGMTHESIYKQYVTDFYSPGPQKSKKIEEYKKY